MWRKLSPVIFHPKNVKYTLQLERELPFQNKETIWHLHHFAFWTFGQPYSSARLLHPFCMLSFLGGSRRELGTTLLGILPDGYLLWIRAKSQPGLECVCWTVHCISGDHTGSISTSKSLCCPLSLSQHAPQGTRVKSSRPAGNLCLEAHIHPATNYPSTSSYTVYDYVILVAVLWDIVKEKKT